MKDEIKEILKEIESYENKEICLVILSQEQNKALLDYITNLQQENKRLKEWKEDLDTIRKDAIKYINKYCIDDEFYINLTYKEKAIFEVLKILKTGDE